MDPLSWIRKVAAMNAMHPYKVNIEHELHEDDFDRRIQFCEEVNDLCEENDSQLSSILFFWRGLIFVKWLG